MTAVKRGFVDVAQGQVHYRYAGARSAASLTLVKVPTLLACAGSEAALRATVRQFEQFLEG